MHPKNLTIFQQNFKLSFKWVFTVLSFTTNENMKTCGNAFPPNYTPGNSTWRLNKCKVVNRSETVFSCVLQLLNLHRPFIAYYETVIAQKRLKKLSLPIRHNLKGVQVCGWHVFRRNLTFCDFSNWDLVNFDVSEMYWKQESCRTLSLQFRFARHGVRRSFPGNV